MAIKCEDPEATPCAVVLRFTSDKTGAELLSFGMHKADAAEWARLILAAAETEKEGKEPPR